MSPWSWHFSMAFSPCQSPNVQSASCENLNFSHKKGSFKSSFMTACSPELDFFPPELVVQVVVVTSPDISLLYKLTLAALGLELEQILLKEWWMYFVPLLCHLSSRNNHFHVKLLILSFSPPSSPPPLFSLLAFSQNTAHISLVMHLFITLPPKSHCTTYCKYM